MLHNVCFHVFCVLFISLSVHGTVFVDVFMCSPLLEIIVSPDKSQGCLGFSTVTLPLRHRFPLGRDNLKNILVRPLKLGMWVYMGNATNSIVL